MMKFKRRWTKKLRYLMTAIVLALAMFLPAKIGINTNALENVQSNLDIEKIKYTIENDNLEIKGYNGKLPTDPIFPTKEEWVDFLEDDIKEIKISNSAFKSNNIEGKLILPNGYTEIGMHAFAENKITDLSLESVTEIKVAAFEGNLLKELILPNAKIIESWSFNRNKSLTTVELPNATYIGESAFSYAGNHKNISKIKINSIEKLDDNHVDMGMFKTETLKVLHANSVKEVPAWFLGNHKIEEVKMDSVETIGDFAFVNNEIKELYLPNLVEVGEKAFHTNALHKIDLPKLESIKLGAFEFNNLGDINIPKVKYISGWAFNGNKSITTLDLPKVEVIEEYAFINTNMNKLNAPKLREIGDKAFQSNSLVDVRLPEVERVGKAAFEHNNIQNLDLSKVEIIDDWAFHENESIEKVQMSNVIEIGEFSFSNNKLQALDLPKVEKIGDGAFSLNMLTNIDLPNVKHIGSSAFSTNQIEIAKIPNVEYLGNHAFWDNKLKKLNLNSLPIFADEPFKFNEADILYRILFPIYVNGESKNQVMTEKGIVINPTEAWMEEFRNSVKGDSVYITEVPRTGFNRGFATGIDLDGEYYYCASLYTTFYEGFFKEHEVKNSVYVIEHGNQVFDENDQLLLTTPQLVSIDEKPENYLYAYTGDLISKIVYHGDLLIDELDEDLRINGSDLVHLITSNLDIKDVVVLNSKNVHSHVKDTQFYSQVILHFGEDFIETLFERVKLDTREYTNSKYYEYDLNHEYNDQEYSQPVMKPGSPIETWTTFDVEKKWIGGPSSYPSIEVGLFRNNVLIDSVELNEHMEWKFLWKDLPMTDKYGQPYEYKIDELSEIEGYQSSVDGNVITNTFIEEPPVETPEEPPVETPEEPPVETPEEPPVEIPEEPPVETPEEPPVGTPEEPPVETPEEPPSVLPINRPKDELPTTGSFNIKYISGLSIALGFYILRKRKHN